MKVLKYTYLEIQMNSFQIKLIVTNGCLVNQCRRTFSTRIVEAVLTIMYSFALCSFEPNGIVLLLVAVAWVETDPPPVLSKLNI